MNKKELYNKILQLNGLTNEEEVGTVGFASQTKEIWIVVGG